MKILISILLSLNFLTVLPVENITSTTQDITQNVEVTENESDLPEEDLPPEEETPSEEVPPEEETPSEETPSEEETPTETTDTEETYYDESYESEVETLPNGSISRTSALIGLILFISGLIVLIYRKFERKLEQEL